MFRLAEIGYQASARTVASCRIVLKTIAFDEDAFIGHQALKTRNARGKVNIRRRVT
jgi:hypothetical protein